VHILYVTHWYPPEMGATAARVSELSRIWVKAGHTVTVLTGFPNHPVGEIHPAYRGRLWRCVMRETLEGVRVVRTWIYPAPNRRAWERIANYFSFFLSACLTGTFLPRPDVVIGTSPQPLVGLAAWVIGRLKRCPFIFEVRDLWPESVVASGMSREGSWLIRVLDVLISFLYRHARIVVVVTEAFRDRLVSERAIPPEKVRVIENGVEPDRFRPNSAEGIRSRYGLDDTFVISYIGMIGHAHGLDVVLQAAPMLAVQLPAMRFLLVGEGAHRERLEAAARSRGLTNVVFVGEQPRERIPAFINASDACLVHLRREEVFKTVIPSKMLEFMACARPVILGVDGQARQILQDAWAGIFIKPEDPEELVQAILRLHRDPALRAEMGERGRRHVLAHFSRARKADEYLELLQELHGPRPARPEGDGNG
jgi:glycosyltransferase involved in cell wall biosynthesis